MTLEQLRVFVCVAECEHMTRAAQTLNLTQSATSAAIAALEERHGVKLFDRIGRRIALTAAGRVFLERSESGAGARRGGRAGARRSRRPQDRRARRSPPARPSAVTGCRPASCDFRAAYPGVTIKLRIGNTDEGRSAGERRRRRSRLRRGRSRRSRARRPADRRRRIGHRRRADGARLLDGLDAEPADGGALGGARKGLGHARRLRGGADRVRRRRREEKHRAGAALERGDPRRGGSGRGPGGDVAPRRQRLDQGGFADRFAARPAAPPLFPAASQGALRSRRRRAPSCARSRITTRGRRERSRVTP